MSGPESPRPLGGWRRVAALAWVAGVVGLYLAVRQLGLHIVP